jgi:hypothetical protein
LNIEYGQVLQGHGRGSLGLFLFGDHLLARFFSLLFVLRDGFLPFPLRDYQAAGLPLFSLFSLFFFVSNLSGTAHAVDESINFYATLTRNERASSDEDCTTISF